MTPRTASLAAISPRRGLNREEAAIYVGVSPVKFDELVKTRRMPAPRRIDGRNVWDIRELDRYFERLPGGSDEEEKNPWDGHPLIRK